MARFASGINGMASKTPPVNMPADPSPAIARPMMKAIEFGAEPHMADPTVKRKRLIK